MKLNHALLFTFTLVAGCYSPQLGNPGFFCHPEDKPACPDGQKCVPTPDGNNRCVSTGVNIDGGVHDLAQRDGSSLHDMAQGNHDFSTNPQPDFSVPVDLSGGGMLCMCSMACIISPGGCVGPNCCLEDSILGLCTPDPTCTPN